MKKLRKLYKLAKEHPYREHRFGSPKSYGEILDKLGEEFILQVDKIYGKHATREVTPKHPFGKWAFEHQYWGIVLALKRNYKYVNEYVAIAEHLLHTIHAFIDSGKLEFFWMNFGYTKGCGHDEWKWNPMSAYKFVYYPQYEEWDMDKLSAERYLKVTKRKLEEKETYQAQRIEEGKEPSEITKLMIDYYTSRIQRLKEIGRT